MRKLSALHSNLYTISYLLFASALLYFSGLMIAITIPYFSFENDVDFLLVKQDLLANKLWIYSFYIHISTSPLVLVSGIFQFYRPFQIRFPRVHRYAGYLYGGTILLLSAPSGLVMAFYANGGWAAKISFILISVLWWFFTARAILRVLRKEIIPHRADMLRSYALTLSAITLRLYVFIIPMISDLRGIPMYVIVSWLSWIPNLLVAEFIIRKVR
jgi:hypothetical protein